MRLLELHYSFQRTVPCAALALLVSVAYLSAWNAGFVYDDNPHITRSPTMTSSLRSLGDIWLHPRMSPQYYPVTHTAWWVMYQLWAFAPAGYHAVNILLHTAVACLLATLLLHLGMTPVVAWLSAAIFAVHPIHVETVAYVSELKNLLAAAFALAAALLYWHFVKQREKEVPVGKRTGGWGVYAGAIVCCGLGLLSKSIIGPLPIVLVVLMWWRHGRVRWDLVWPLLPMALMSLAMGLVTVWIEIHHVGVDLYPEAFGLSFGERCLLAGRVAWFYVGKLLWPVPLMMNYERWHVDMSMWWQWLFSGSAVLVVAGLWFARRRIGRGPVTAALTYVLTLSPALGFCDVYPFRFSYVADHYVYLASIALIAGTVYLLMAGAARWEQTKAIGVVVGLPVILVLSLATFAHAKAFVDESTLWRDTLAKNPGSWLAHAQLAVLATQEGQLAVAERHIREAIALGPDLADLRNHLANVLWAQERREEAVAVLQQAISANSFNSKTLLDLGFHLAELGRVESAVELCRRAIESSPNPDGGRWAVGVALFKAGEYERSAAELQGVVEAWPDDADAYLHLAQARLALGQIPEAIAAWRTGLRLRPDDTDACAHLGRTLLVMNRFNDAIPYLRNAVRRRPQQADYRLALARACSMAGQHLEALQQLRHAVTLAPSSPAVHYAVAGVQAQAGRLEEAVAEATLALNLAQAQGQLAMLNDIRDLLRWLTGTEVSRGIKSND